MAFVPFDDGLKFGDCVLVNPICAESQIFDYLGAMFGHQAFPVRAQVPVQTEIAADALRVDVQRVEVQPPVVVVTGMKLFEVVLLPAGVAGVVPPPIRSLLPDIDAVDLPRLVEESLEFGFWFLGSSQMGVFSCGILSACCTCSITYGRRWKATSIGGSCTERCRTFQKNLNLCHQLPERR